MIQSCQYCQLHFYKKLTKCKYCNKAFKPSKGIKMSKQRMHINEAKQRLKEMENQLLVMNGQDKSGYLQFQISEFKAAITKFESK